MIKISTEELEDEATKTYILVHNILHDPAVHVSMDVSQFQLQTAVVFLDIIRTELNARWQEDLSKRAMSNFSQRSEEPCQCP